MTSEDFKKEEKMEYGDKLCYQGLKQRSKKEYFYFRLKDLKLSLIEQKVHRDSIECRASEETHTQDELARLSRLNNEIEDLKTYINKVEGYLQELCLQ